MIRDFLSALKFLTVLPVPVPARAKKEAPGGAAFFFPAVGFLIGLASIWAYAFCLPHVPERIANLVLLALPFALSGGRHFEGFCDFFESFSFSGRGEARGAGARTVPRAVLAGALLLLAKFELLEGLPLKAVSFVWALAASRWAQVVLRFYLPEAREGSAGKVGVRELAGATATLFLVTLWLGRTGLFVFLGLLGFLWIFGGLAVKRAGGLTEESLGAATELSELFIFLLIVLML